MTSTSNLVNVIDIHMSESNDTGWHFCNFGATAPTAFVRGSLRYGSLLWQIAATSSGKNFKP